jgi:hypothetical protein
MRKYLFAAALAVAGLFVVPTAANALMIAFMPAPQRALTADVVIVGKVTAIEKDTIDAEPFPGSKQKVAYKVAVVKIETGLAGANAVTHVKIGFVPPPKADPPQPVDPNLPVRPIRPRPGIQMPELKEGTEMLFFLSKHPGADFYSMSPMSPPVDVKSDGGKKELEQVKKVMALVAEPLKGLKSEKPEVRNQTAAALVQKYRAYPQFATGEPKQEAIDKEESKLILKAIAEADWKQQVRPVPGDEFGFFNPISAFYQLGLNDKDGWKPPVIPPQVPGAPPIDFNALQKETFVKWLDGPGKDYVIKKFVSKKANEK